MHISRGLRLSTTVDALLSQVRGSCRAVSLTKLSPHGWALRYSWVSLARLCTCLGGGLRVGGCGCGCGSRLLLCVPCGITCGVVSSYFARKFGPGGVDAAVVAEEAAGTAVDPACADASTGGPADTANGGAVGAQSAKSARQATVAARCVSMAAKVRASMQREAAWLTQVCGRVQVRVFVVRLMLMMTFVLLLVFCAVGLISATPLLLPPLCDRVLVAYLRGRTGPGVAPQDACPLEGAGNARGTASGVGN